MPSLTRQNLNFAPEFPSQPPSIRAQSLAFSGWRLTKAAKKELLTADRVSILRRQETDGYMGVLPNIIKQSGLPKGAAEQTLDNLAKLLRAIDDNLLLPPLEGRLGNAAIRIEPADQGHVGRVYRLSLQNGPHAQQPYALKVYFRPPDLPDQMYGSPHGIYRESALGINMAAKNANKNTSHLHWSSLDTGAALYEWIDPHMSPHQRDGQFLHDFLRTHGLFHEDNGNGNFSQGGICWDHGGFFYTPEHKDYLARKYTFQGYLRTVFDVGVQAYQTDPAVRDYINACTGPHGESFAHYKRQLNAKKPLYTPQLANFLWRIENIKRYQPEFSVIKQQFERNFLQYFRENRDTILRLYMMNMVCYLPPYDRKAFLLKLLDQVPQAAAAIGRRYDITENPEDWNDTFNALLQKYPEHPDGIKQASRYLFYLPKNRREEKFYQVLKMAPDVAANLASNIGSLPGTKSRLQAYQLLWSQFPEARPQAAGEIWSLPEPYKTKAYQTASKTTEYLPHLIRSLLKEKAADKARFQSLLENCIQRLFLTETPHLRDIRIAQ